jgi:hypothetical protein
MRHIAYTPNLIPTPYMQQRETRKEEQKKERNINPKRNKDTPLSLTTNEGCAY